MYAVGKRHALEEWTSEVKNWQWLALKTRIAVETCEPLSGVNDMDIQGMAGNGQWTEVEKVGEALEWLKRFGRDDILLDLGIGARSNR